MQFSPEILSLVRTVERLATEDQRRIVRLVDLLSAAPDDLRRHAQQMLRTLVAGQPETRTDCVSEVDTIIAYLEKKLLGRVPDPFMRTVVPAAEQ